MAEGGEEDNHERSMRLLQPKLKVLYYVWKKNGVRNNISQISRDLRYKKDSWINDTVHSLIQDGFLATRIREDTEYLVLTRKGRRKIAPLVVSWIMPLMIIIIALIPFSWAISEAVDRVQVQPFVLALGSLLILLVGCFLFYEVRQLEKEYFGIVNRTP